MSDAQSMIDRFRSAPPSSPAARRAQRDTGALREMWWMDGSASPRRAAPEPQRRGAGASSSLREERRRLRREEEERTGRARGAARPRYRLAEAEKGSSAAIDSLIAADIAELGGGRNPREADPADAERSGGRGERKGRRGRREGRAGRDGQDGRAEFDEFAEFAEFDEFGGRDGRDGRARRRAPSLDDVGGPAARATATAERGPGEHRRDGRLRRARTQHGGLGAPLDAWRESLSAARKLAPDGLHRVALRGDVSNLLRQAELRRETDEALYSRSKEDRRRKISKVSSPRIEINHKASTTDIAATLDATLAQLGNTFGADSLASAAALPPPGAGLGAYAPDDDGVTALQVAQDLDAAFMGIKRLKEEEELTRAREQQERSEIEEALRRKVTAEVLEKLAGRDALAADALDGDGPDAGALDADAAAALAPLATATLATLEGLPTIDAIHDRMARLEALSSGLGPAAAAADGTDAASASAAAAAAGSAVPAIAPGPGPGPGPAADPRRPAPALGPHAMRPNCGAMAAHPGDGAGGAARRPAARAAAAGGGGPGGAAARALPGATADIASDLEVAMLCLERRLGAGRAEAEAEAEKEAEEEAEAAREADMAVLEAVGLEEGRAEDRSDLSAEAEDAPPGAAQRPPSPGPGPSPPRRRPPTLEEKMRELDGLSLAPPHGDPFTFLSSAGDLTHLRAEGRALVAQRIPPPPDAAPAPAFAPTFAPAPRPSAPPAEEPAAAGGGSAAERRMRELREELRGGRRGDAMLGARERLGRFRDLRAQLEGFVEGGGGEGRPRGPVAGAAGDLLDFYESARESTARRVGFAH